MLTKLFPFLKKKPKPTELISNSVLGSLAWSKEEEGWIGNFNGFRFVLDYEDQEFPTESLTEFAKAFLTNSESISSEILQAKASSTQACPQSLVNEINGLQIAAVSFFKVKGEPYVFISFNGGADDRCWRLEHTKGEWSGLGFDD